MRAGRLAFLRGDKGQAVGAPTTDALSFAEQQSVGIATMRLFTAFQSPFQIVNPILIINEV